MEFKQSQILLGEDGQIKWTIVYSVCRVQKAFDWMEIRAVLEALSMKGIKEMYIGTMIYVLFKNLWSATSPLDVEMPRQKHSRRLERSIISITSLYKVALYTELL